MNSPEKIGREASSESTESFDIAFPASFNLDEEEKGEIRDRKIEPLDGIDPKPGNIYLIFHRHGEHVVLPDVPDKDHPLSEKGHEEIAESARELGVFEKQAVGFHANNLRSRTSVVTMMRPEIPFSEIDEKTREYGGEKRIAALPALDYKKVFDKKFRKGLDEAVQTNSVLRFLTYESNTLAGDHLNELSTYFSISQDIAAILKKYAEIENRWSELSEKYPVKNLYRLFCAREYIYACFRTRATEVVAGLDAKNAFIEAFEEGVESQDSPTTAGWGVVEIGKNKDGKIEITIRDTSGELVITEDQLSEIIGETKDNSRLGAYCLPVRKNTQGELEVALVEYPDGFSFIGGGVQKGEGLKEGLLRELQEELGDSKDSIDLNKSIRVKKTYSFLMKEKSRPNEGEHVENHAFFVTPVESGSDLSFAESGASIKWVSESDLLSDSLIQHPEMRLYIKEAIAPILESLKK